jgi:hypothetical protein
LEENSKMGQIIGFVAAIITIAWFVSEATTGTNPRLAWIFRILVACGSLFLCYFVFIQGKQLKLVKRLKPIVKISKPLPNKPGELVNGRTWVIGTNSYRVAVFLYVDGGWWNKPFNERPMSPIFVGGEWSCDIFNIWETDRLATKARLFLLDRSVNPPEMNGQREFPEAFVQQAIDVDEVDLNLAVAVNSH